MSKGKFTRYFVWHVFFGMMSVYSTARKKVKGQSQAVILMVSNNKILLAFVSLKEAFVETSSKLFAVIDVHEQDNSTIRYSFSSMKILVEFSKRRSIMNGVFFLYKFLMNISATAYLYLQKSRLSDKVKLFLNYQSNDFQIKVNQLACKFQSKFLFGCIN